MMITKRNVLTNLKRIRQKRPISYLRINIHIHTDFYAAYMYTVLKKPQNVMRIGGNFVALMDNADRNTLFLMRKLCIHV